MTAPEPNASDLESRLAQALAGQYRIERTLGQGGMGTVFLARDETLDRLVAVKVISPDVGANAEIRQRFLQEARVVARLRHPNIVAVYTAGEANGLLYFVMEYVPGESLRDRLNRESRVPVDDAIPILHELAQALSYAHTAGIVHRDVKPENILLDGESGRAMLMDFGVARALASDARLTGTGFVLGSPKYMSPEQASGDDALDGRSDLYSLGLVGYEMLCGTAAIDAPTAASVLIKQITERPSPLAEKTDGVPSEVTSTIDRLLEKAPDARFQSGNAVAAALVGETYDETAASGGGAHTSGRRARYGQGSSAGSTTGKSASTPSSPARSRRTGLVIAAAAGLAVLLGGSYWAMNRTAANDRAWFVAPFEVQGPNTQQLDWLHEGSVNMLTLSLAQWQDLKVTDYERTLDLLHAEGLDDARRVGLENARKIARSIGAGRIVMGTINTMRDSLEITARLYDVNGNEIDKATQSGLASADPRALFQDVATQLLDIVGGPPLTKNLAEQTTKSIDAYRAYLDGLHHLNAWRLQRADSAFDAAIASDSTFALAYYKKSLALGWVPVFDSIRLHASAQSVVHATRLPSRQQELVRAHDELTRSFYAGQRGDTVGARAGYLASRARLARLVSADSTDAEAWYAFADADFHLIDNSSLGRDADSAAKYYTESLRGFQRTIALDPTFHLAFQHLVQIYARASASGGGRLVLRGDTLYAIDTPEKASRVRAPAQLGALTLAAGVRSREAAVGWLASDPDAMGARRELSNAYLAINQPDSAIGVLEDGVKRPGHPPMLEIMLPYVKARAGKPSAGVQMGNVLTRYPADTLARLNIGDRMAAILGAFTVSGATGMPSLMERASAIMARTDSIMPGTSVPSHFVTDFYSNAIRSGMGLPLTPQQRTFMMNGMRQLKQAPPERRDITIPYMMFLATGDTAFYLTTKGLSANASSLIELDALAALARKDSATAARIVSQFPTVDSLRRSPAIGMTGLRFIARAEALAALGRSRAALDQYELIDLGKFSFGTTPEASWPMFVRSYLNRARLYEQTGDRARAIESYETFLAWWKDAEAPLAPQLREARESIARLRDNGGARPMKTGS